MNLLCSSTWTLAPLGLKNAIQSTYPSPAGATICRMHPTPDLFLIFSFSLVYNHNKVRRHSTCIMHTKAKYGNVSFVLRA